MDLIPIDATTTEERRAQIMALQASMLAMEQVECPVVHHFAPGMYAREIRIPAGTCLVGKIHRHTHIATLAQGVIRVVTDHDDRILEAPATFVSQAGAKNVGLAITDVVWITYHHNPTDTNDLVALEAEHIAPTFDDVELLATVLPTLENMQ